MQDLERFTNDCRRSFSALLAEIMQTTSTGDEKTLDIDPREMIISCAPSATFDRVTVCKKGKQGKEKVATRVQRGKNVSSSICYVIARFQRETRYSCDSSEYGSSLVNYS